MESFLIKKKEYHFGCNISTMLGNMTLDGMQQMLYSLQGKEIKDFKNGYCIRFADDVCISARTEKDAKSFLEELRKFVAERGLKLSEEKTRIVNIKKEGFEFLARFYIFKDGMLKCIPSDRAVRNFQNEVEELIFKNKEKWSQRKLIQSLNAKISGFTTYHKCEESKETFKYLDVIINAFLLKLMTELYPNMPINQIQKKYWKTDSIRKKCVFTYIKCKYLRTKYGRYNTCEST